MFFFLSYLHLGRIKNWRHKCDFFLRSSETYYFSFFYFSFFSRPSVSFLFLLCVSYDTKMIELIFSLIPHKTICFKQRLTLFQLVLFLDYNLWFCWVNFLKWIRFIYYKFGLIVFNLVHHICLTLKFINLSSP